MSGKEVKKWADEYMFRSEGHNASAGPMAHLLGGPNDPLGQIAACAKMYKGEVVRDLADITDEERHYYSEEMKKTKLQMPLESVSLHFMIENVTRAYTHQLVRQRTAAYAQESMRFAVVEDMTEAVALPPSLAGTVGRGEWIDQAVGQGSHHLLFQYGEHRDETREEWNVRLDEYLEKWASSEQRARFKWDAAVGTIGETYMTLVNSGMPAEDARGLMPTNIVTRVNYITNLRGLLDHAGNRLCTQAQFEWRLVFAQIANALRGYGLRATYPVWVFGEVQIDDKIIRTRTDEDGHLWALVHRSSSWQYEALADLLKPVCYVTGKCAFMADFDRKCSIRNRVNANHEVNRPSSEWANEYEVAEKLHPLVAVGASRSSVVREGGEEGGGQPAFIGAIHPREWLANPAAAR